MDGVRPVWLFRATLDVTIECLVQSSMSRKGFLEFGRERMKWDARNTHKNVRSLRFLSMKTGISVYFVVNQRS